MLILAGVSLNALVGDNGIITNAQNANIKSGMAALEEWLQEKYVEYYDESESYVNKVELLSDKISGLLLTNSPTKKYIIYGGKAYYLLNKSVLPDEIQRGLSGGNSTDVSDFTKLIDVYGITTDLKVYYCESGIDSGVYGEIEATAIDPNTSLARLNSSTNSSVKSAITDALAELGIEIDHELGITIGNVSALTEIIIDGTTCSMSDFAALSELTSLRKITLKNLSLKNLDGIENLPLINYMYFYNCDIKDYSKLASVYNLKYLYFYFPHTMKEATANYQITYLGHALHSATKISGLKYLYIVGDLTIFGWGYSDRAWRYPSNSSSMGYFRYNTGIESNLSDISGLGNFADNIKSSVSELFLTNNKITSISTLRGFSSLSNVLLMNNSALTSLEGLENKKSLLYLGASNCSFSNLDGIQGDSGLIYLTVQNNSNLSDITSLKTCTSLVGFYAQNCSLLSSAAGLGGEILGDGGKLTGLGALKYLNFENCGFLTDISEIALCKNIAEIFLAGCPSLNKTHVANLESLFLKCGVGNYSIDSNYIMAFASTTSLSFSGTDFSDDDLDDLSDLTNIKRLKLSGCSSLDNGKVDEVLKTLTGLEYLSLYNCSTVSSIDFVDYMNLVELDLSGTNVTDLTKLNDSSSANLRSLRVSRQKVTINNYSTLITNLFNNSAASWTGGGTDRSSWIGVQYYESSGLLLTGYNSTLDNKVTIKLGEDVKASTIYIGRQCGEFVTFDFSNCSGLLDLYQNTSNCRFILPSSLQILRSEVGGKNNYYDLSNCSENLTTIELRQGATNEDLKNSLSTLPEVNVLTTLSLYRLPITDLTFLESFSATSLRSLTVSGWSSLESRCNNFLSTKGIDSVPSLTTLRITFSNLSDLTGMNSLVNLTKLDMYDNNLTDISKLSGCTSLKTANLYKNSISSIDSLKNISTLETLSIYDNNISSIPDLSTMSSIQELRLSNNNIENLENLKTLLRGAENNKTTTLRTLTLTDNPLEDFASNGFDNHSLLVSLKKAGCSSISIIDTSLSSI